MQQVVSNIKLIGFIAVLIADLVYRKIFILIIKVKYNLAKLVINLHATVTTVL